MKRRKKQKGFTLIELIAILLLLVLLFFIAIPIITKIVSFAKSEICNVDAKMLEKAAFNYVNAKGMVIKYGESKSITIDRLQKAGYLSNMSSPYADRSKCTGYVIVTNNSISQTYFTYKTAIKCGDSCKTAGYDASYDEPSIPNSSDLTIKLNGDETVTIIRSTKYVDAGATATDFIDGDITNKIITSTDVNINKAGTYTVNYSVTNSSGNTATTSRKVIVREPEMDISIIGDNPYNVMIGNSYVDQGATATDELDGDITSSITISTDININKKGNYEITYTATNSLGNKMSATRNVNVYDGAPPILTILGSNPATIAAGSIYNDAGATAYDDVDGDLTSSIITTSNINPNILGSYTVTYSVSDSSDNKVVKTRTVKVTDQTAPSCSSSGGNSNWVNTNITLTGTCTDSYSGCKGNVVKTYSTETNSNNESPGTVYDNSNNATVCPANQQVHIDKTAPSKPTINLNGYASGSWTNGNVTITASSTDNLSGIAYYQFTVDGGATISTMPNPWTINWDGQWQFYVRAIDKAGNASAWSDTFIIRRETGAPAITGTSTSCYNVSMSASDPTSGISRYGISTGGAITWYGSTATSFNFGLKTPGTYYLYVADNAGNITGTSVYFDYSTLASYLNACQLPGTYVNYSDSDDGGSKWRLLFANSTRVYLVPKSTLGTYTYTVLNDANRYNNVATNIGYYDTAAASAISALDTASGKYVNSTYSDQGKSIDLQYISDYANYAKESNRTNWSRTNVVYQTFKKYSDLIDINKIYWVADHHLCRDQYSSPTSACTTPFRIYHVNTNGTVDDLDTPANRAIRPVIRLKTNVYYTGTGTGAETSPLGIVAR